MAFENNVIVVESMMRKRFIQSSVPLHRLSEEMTTFAHGNFLFLTKTKKPKRADTARDVSPNFMMVQKVLPDSNNYVSSG